MDVGLFQLTTTGIVVTSATTANITAAVPTTATTATTSEYSYLVSIVSYSIMCVFLGITTTDTSTTTSALVTDMEVITPKQLVSLPLEQGLYF